MGICAEPSQGGCQERGREVAVLSVSQVFFPEEPQACELAFQGELPVPDWPDALSPAD